MSRGIVEQFRALKREADADLLFMQVGDFYELFGEDAEFAGDELDLKVSEKSAGGTTHPMAGVPVDELTPYLKALVERGHRVAVADQHETTAGHEREVTRVVTPGTLLETAAAEARYLSTVTEVEGRCGLALVDVTTGRFLATTVADTDAAVDELARFAPTEVLPGPTLRNDEPLLDAVRGATDATLTLHDSDAFAPGRARHRLRERFGDGALDAVGLTDGAGIAAAGAALAYVEATNAGAAAAVTRIEAYDGGDHVTLDATTQRNLELVETMRGEADGSLLATLDHTATSGGRRLLREWLTRPRRDRETIEARHDAVEAFAAAALARDRMRELLGGASDLERLASRAASESAGPADLLAVQDTLTLLPDLREAMAGTALAGSPAAGWLDEVDVETATDLAARIDAALVEDPPASPSDGGLFGRGHDDDLDELIDRHEAAREWFETLADRESAATGITHLSVGRTATDGYYIQVGKSETDAVPERYREIKTLKNSRRYVTDELEEREREILRAEEARAERERALFADLRETVAARGELLRAAGRALATLDCTVALATHAVENDWTRPELDDDPSVLEVEAGRHPVVERTTDFVPNDLRLDRGRSFLLVTGPNMSGKSTYMRQAALIVLLAQAGSFVPADRARVGLVDGIYTRVGALDELAQGRSTFMVEMQELANILHSATDESLVVLDEVGRGTATYDGISIAWAATEYLSGGRGGSPSPRVLFATHYHELTELAERIDGVENVHMAADEDDGDVTFLRTVREGAADRSYGVHVAALAGVPEPVVDRSREVLGSLREDRAVDVRGGDEGESTQVVFDLDSGELRGDASADGGAVTEGPEEAVDPETEAVVSELRNVDLAELSPAELLQRVEAWQNRV